MRESGAPRALDRDCGGCTACCTHLPIEAPGFFKPAGALCTYCADGVGCGIYSNRPQPCREFLCGWRALDIIPESLRPDRSGIIAVPDEEKIPPGYADMSGVKFIVTGDGAALGRLEVIECIAGLVHARAPTFLAIPHPKTGFFTRIFLNRRLEAATDARDAAALEHLITQALNDLRASVL